jgi:hypothetical protein
MRHRYSRELGVGGSWREAARPSLLPGRTSPTAAGVIHSHSPNHQVVNLQLTNVCLGLKAL